MSSSFEVIETVSRSLWDFGWFDWTSFRIDGATFECDRDVVDQFLAHPIYQRSFCERPDPWGVAVDRHGPFSCFALSPTWLRLRTYNELQDRVYEILDDPSFNKPATLQQRLPVDRWLNDLERQRDVAFELDAPADESVRVDWAFVWVLFHEFLCVNRQQNRLTVAIIGYD